MERRRTPKGKFAAQNSNSENIEPEQDYLTLITCSKKLSTKIIMIILCLTLFTPWLFLIKKYNYFSIPSAVNKFYQESFECSCPLENESTSLNNKTTFNTL